MFHLAWILLLGIDPYQDLNCVTAFRNVEVCLQNGASFLFHFMLTNSQVKLQYHAQQICGIAQSKPEGSCRVNSVQPLYYGTFLFFLLCYSATNFFLSTAGCCFSKTEERNAAALMLESIEEDLGWAAKYRANDLYRQWGWRRSFSNA